MQRSVLTLGLVVAVLGCTEPEHFGFGDVEPGGACKQASDCIAGLQCKEEGETKTCQPLDDVLPETLRGKSCSSDDECKDEPGYWCGRQGACVPYQPAPEGASCALSLECAADLVCGSSGACMPVEACPDADEVPPEIEANGEAACQTRDIGEACNRGECRRPYVCDLTGSCNRAPYPTGTPCTRSDNEGGRFRFYFEVPRPNADASEDPRAPDHEDFEFYRLPFPSNIRTDAEGRISLRGHGSPGEVLGVDVTAKYFTGLEQDNRYFAQNSPIFVRSSDPLDAGSLCLSADSVCPDGPSDEASPRCDDACTHNVLLVDLDSDERLPMELAMSAERGLYICQNWLGVAPLPGRPLAPNTNYALLVTTSVRDRSGATPIPDRDLVAMLANAEPEGDTALSTAYAKMKPLRDWLAASPALEASDIAAAAVFKTGDPAAVAHKLLQAVEGVHAGDTPPSFGSDAVLCPLEGAAALPVGCDQDRFACGDANEVFYEVRGTFSAPGFQHGTPPFEREGGTFQYDADGVPEPLATLEERCYSLAIPKAVDGPKTMPAGGWPVVIYGHGTGGSFVSGIRDGTAQLLAEAGFAVLSFDNVMHGRRQGSTDPQRWQRPGELFFNLLNPRAARDNILQGAADIMNLVSLVTRDDTELLSVLPGDTTSVLFDPDRVYYLGHSQGTVIAPAFVAADPRVKAVVFSGAGAELPLSILNKKKPVNSAEVFGTFFGDRSLSRVHPIMGVVAQLFASADAVAYGPLFTRPRGPAGNEHAPHYLHVMGVGDSYTPDVTQHALLRASGVPLVVPPGGGPLEPIADLTQIEDSPYSNADGPTAGAIQYMHAPGRDGHFVFFDEVTNAGQAVVEFLTAAASDDASVSIER